MKWLELVGITALALNSCQPAKTPALSQQERDSQLIAETDKNLTVTSRVVTPNDEPWISGKALKLDITKNQASNLPYLAFALVQLTPDDSILVIEDHSNSSFPPTEVCEESIFVKTKGYRAPSLQNKNPDEVAACFAQVDVAPSIELLGGTITLARGDNQYISKVVNDPTLPEPYIMYKDRKVPISDMVKTLQQLHQADGKPNVSIIHTTHQVPSEIINQLLPVPTPVPTFIPTPTTEQQVNPAVEGAVPPVNPVEVVPDVELLPQSSSEVAKLTATVNLGPDDHLTIYKFTDPFFSKMLEQFIERVNMDATRIKEFIIELKDIIGREKVLGPIMNEVEIVDISNGSYTFELLHASNNFPAEYFARYGNEFVYFTVDKDMAPLTIYTAMSADGQIIPSATETYNQLQQLILEETNLFGGLKPEHTQVYTMAPEYVPDFLAKSKDINRDSLIAQAHRANPFTSGNIHDENGDAFPSSLIPTGLPLEQCKIDTEVVNWLTLESGETQDTLVRSSVVCKLKYSFGLQDKPDYITPEELQVFDQELTRIFGPNRPGQITIEIPLANVVPAYAPEQAQSETTYLATFEAPEIPYGTQLNPILREEHEEVIKYAPKPPESLYTKPHMRRMADAASMAAKRQSRLHF